MISCDKQNWTYWYITGDVEKYIHCTNVHWVTDTLNQKWVKTTLLFINASNFTVIKKFLSICKETELIFAKNLLCGKYNTTIILTYLYVHSTRIFLFIYCTETL